MKNCFRMSKLKQDKSEIQSICHLSKKDFNKKVREKRIILHLVGLAYNISQGNIPLTRAQVKELSEYRNFLSTLGCPKATYCEKKKLLENLTPKKKKALKLIIEIVCKKLK